MNALKKMAQRMSNSRPSSFKATSVFTALDEGDVDGAFSLVSTLSENEFRTFLLRQDRVPLLMDLALNDNLDALHKFSVLPYFKNLVNDATEDEGWTAIMAATA